MPWVSQTRLMQPCTARQADHENKAADTPALFVAITGGLLPLLPSLQSTSSSAPGLPPSQPPAAFSFSSLVLASLSSDPRPAQRSWLEPTPDASCFWLLPDKLSRSSAFQFQEFNLWHRQSWPISCLDLSCLLPEVIRHYRNALITMATWKIQVAIFQ